MRTALRTIVLAGATGVLAVSVAWAGVGISPVPGPTLPGAEVGSTAANAKPALDEAAAGERVAALTGKTGLAVGASRTSIEPKPDAGKGEVWERDLTKCVRLIDGDVPNTLKNVGDHLASTGTPWPENPNCIYQGGYGLGPMFPVSKFDQELGLWVRTIAIGDGADTFVLTVLDGEGWLWDYKSKCTDCGAKQIGQALAADPELAAKGVKAASFALHATHSHTSPDFIGGWGFVPDWYMAQVTKAIKDSVREAVLGMVPAAIEHGAIDARKHNSERRPTYRSAEETEMTWLRAVATTNEGPTKKGDVLATLGAFAAHPVTQSESAGIAHPDFPGYFAKRAEQRFGGVGMHFMTGLGNVTGAKSEQRNAQGEITRESTGTSLAELIPATGDGKVATGYDVRLAQRTWRQPVTNVPLDALGTPGLFDRKFDAMPAKVAVRDGSTKADERLAGDPSGLPETSACVSAGPQSVELPATVVKIGHDLVFTTGPGELFSNLTNTIKEKAPDQTVFPLAQVNDALGYMPQSFELSPVGQQGLGFALNGFLIVNYEDSYAIDRCVGDMALETILETLSGLPAHEPQPAAASKR